MFNDKQLAIIKYCAEECSRQSSGEESVYDMVNAWDYALNHHRNMISDTSVEITLEFIEQIGKLVEPHENAKGFRKIPIGVSNGYNWIEKAPWEHVPDLLKLLIEQYYAGELFADKNPVYIFANHKLSKSAEDQFYYEYENIHPFVDGNGRTGKILYNYLKSTLDNPVMPPNFWGSSNP